MSSTLYFKSVDASFCDCRGFWGNIARRRVRRAIFPKLRGNNFQWWPITPVSICFVIPRRNTKQIHRLFVHNTANNSMTSRTHGLKTSTFSITSFSCTYMPQLISMQLPVFSRPYCTQHLSVCLSVCLSVRPSVCLWRCTLWLNDTCYNKSVWTSELNRNNMISQLSTLHVDPALKLPPLTP